MNKILVCFLALLIIHVKLFSQNNEFNYYDLEIGRYNKLRPKTLEGVKWLDNNSIVYIKGDSLLKREMNKEIQVLATLDEINSGLKKLKLGSLYRFPITFSVLERETIILPVSGSQVMFNTANNEAEIMLNTPREAENIENYKDFSKAVYTKGQNIFYVDLKKEYQVSDDSIPGIVNGQTVHRNEFGIKSGAYWSPQGNKVAYYRKDESMVTTYPLVYIDKRIAGLKEIRYPMAGMKSEEVTVRVVDLNTGNKTGLKTGGDPEQYLTNLSWSPDEREIYIQQLNRAQNHMWLVKYNAETGTVIDTLFEERHSKYVEPLNPIVFSKGSPEKFYYQSSKSGFNHIYQYNEKSQKLVQLTKGDWEVTHFIGEAPDGKSLYFMGTKDTPLERHLYRLNLKNNKVYKLTEGAGVHSVSFSKDFSKFIDKYSSAETPNKIEIRNSDGKKLAGLLEARNPLKSYKLGDVEVGTFTGGDNKTELYYRIVKPVDFDPEKKYPVVFYIYGGPHLQLIQNTWAGRTELWHQYLAQKGIIGITIDTRGSSGRGKEFENIIHRQSGIPQMEDIVKGVEYFSAKSYVDKSRMGIHGWSYGGYMTLTMMVRHPEIFKVGVAGGPVTNWDYYEIMYGERYMDTPNENPEGYELTDLANYAGKLKGKLKIIHGSVDPVVVWQQSMSFVQSCIKEGVVVDYFMYPLHEHNVVGYDRKHLVKIITEYFIENL